MPSWIEAFSARLDEDAQPSCRTISSTDSDSARPICRFSSDIDVRGQLAGRDPVNQSLYLWSKTVLPGYILTVLGDRMEMAHSIEGRVPFLDHHVVEVIRSQPVSQKIRGMTEKYVLREAARDVITDTVYRRQKHPFLAPPCDPQSRPAAQCAGAGHAARPGAGLDARSSIGARSSTSSTGSRRWTRGRVSPSTRP